MFWSIARSLTGLLVCVGVAGIPLALAAEARPNADEECVMQCDEQSDKCMSDAAGDDDKAKACDDKYSDCLGKCK